jgi:hypothetical protein
MPLLNTFKNLILKDEEVDRTEGDTLNGFPSKKLTLQPGGCGFYQIPIKPGQINSFVQPAKKQGEVYWVTKSPFKTLPFCWTLFFH